ncbi:MAG: triose-phosphate isomerase [Emcibacter sp.]|nr:triose-phosphate isomerase [Emcibacter sp.]
MTTPKALVAGNWKMNGLMTSVREINALSNMIEKNGAGCEVLICPPATLIHALSGKGIDIGAQDCHMMQNGAHTGDISAVMLKDLGCRYVIVGHSERRADHFETNDMVKAKAHAAQMQGLTAIICVGETNTQRENGETLDVVTSQIMGSIPEDAAVAGTVIAYEPVWAIGTGKTPTTEDVAEVHAVIRALLLNKFGTDGNMVRIQYGGSVKASNAKELMAVPNVNGALVGGASLKAEDFYGIITAYQS